MLSNIKTHHEQNPWKYFAQFFPRLEPALAGTALPTAPEPAATHCQGMAETPPLRVMARLATHADDPA